MTQNYILTLNFVMEKIINILKTHWSTKPNNYIYKTNFKNNLHILEDGASVVQVGGIEQVIVKILFKIW